MTASEDPDPTEWTQEECQCDAEPLVTALCNKTTFYPPDIEPRDWETIGDLYYQIVSPARTHDMHIRYHYTIPGLGDSLYYQIVSPAHCGPPSSD